MTLSACYCRFQREKFGPWESGLAVTDVVQGMVHAIYVEGPNYSVELIKDPPWDIKLIPHFNLYLPAGYDL